MTLHILRTPVEEVWRVPHFDGEQRWCFTCRARRTFEHVVAKPVCITGEETGCWYGPSHRIECTVCKREDADCFPGTQREWRDE